MRRAASLPTSLVPGSRAGTGGPDPVGGARVSNTAHPPAVDAGRLWAGGAATAVVAALVALVGVLVAEGPLDIVMVRPPLLPVGGSFGVRYAVTAAVLALVATAS